MPSREVFVGPRLRVRVPGAVRARSAATLVVLAVAIGLTLGAALSAGVAYAVQALLHAVRSGG